MAESFSVGEIAIIVAASEWPERIGWEVEIIAPLGDYSYCSRFDSQIRIATGYRIRMPEKCSLTGTSTAVCKPEFLRKRRPPQDWVKLCRLNETPIKEPAHV